MASFTDSLLTDHDWDNVAVAHPQNATSEFDRDPGESLSSSAPKKTKSRPKGRRSRTKSQRSKRSRDKELEQCVTSSTCSEPLSLTTGRSTFASKTVERHTIGRRRSKRYSNSASMNSFSDKNATETKKYRSSDDSEAHLISSHLHAGQLTSADSNEEWVSMAQPHSVAAIAVGLDGQPQTSNSVSCFLLSRDSHTLRIQVNDLYALPTQRLVVGIEGKGGSRSYATVQAKKTNSLAAGLEVLGEFGGPDVDPLHPDNILPRFNFLHRRLQTRTSEDVLEQWANLGVLNRRVEDRVNTCPDCGALPTFRNGCGKCGFAPLVQTNYVHHFACAHVGPVDEFRPGVQHASQGLCCPKCQASRLVVGSDFDLMRGVLSCPGCKQTLSRPDLVAQCLGCDLRFPAESACEKDIVIYHVNRLDTLALIAEAK